MRPNIVLERFDEKTPFGVDLSSTLTKTPTVNFWVHPAASYNPKTKSAARGFALVGIDVVRHFTMRLMAHAVVAFPELQVELERFAVHLRESKATEPVAQVEEKKGGAV
jgi:hypothetical protein